MIYAVLSLILAPLSIALLILYLQQLSKVSELRSENDALKDAARKAKEDADCFQHLLAKARDYYDERVDQTEESKQRIANLCFAWEDLARAIIDLYKRSGKNTGGRYTGKTILSGWKPEEAQQDTTDNCHNQSPPSASSGAGRI